MKTAQEYANELFQLKNWTDLTFQELAFAGRITKEKAKDIAFGNSKLWFDKSDINASLQMSEDVASILEVMIEAENLK